MPKADTNIYKHQNIDNRTFYQVSQDYLSSARSRIASTTCDRYQDALERDIYPQYADTPMIEVTYAEMNRFLEMAPESAARRGRTITRSSLQLIKSVMRGVIDYGNGMNSVKREVMTWEKKEYEELSVEEQEIICRKAKHNHTPEMLAALLSIYCGLRTGEICALSSDDVNTSENEIYIHEIVHRVKNPRRDEKGQSRTIVIVEELSRKNHIRYVDVPGVLSDYISEFKLSGKTLIRGKEDGLMDVRTLEKRLIRMADVYNISDINFERLRKTFVRGKSDIELLNYIK